MTAPRPTLIVFAKAPRLGRAKSRLAADIGLAGAWRVKRTLDALTLRVARDPRWIVEIAAVEARDLRSAFPGVWPPPGRVARRLQGPGDLGARMARALAAPAIRRGPVAIIGSDAPDLRAADVAAAFKALRRVDVVFGPAEDGGYWLIGARARIARRLTLAPVRWSSPHALSDTLATLPPGVRVGFLRTLADVDDAASLSRRSTATRATRPARAITEPTRRL